MYFLNLFVLYSLSILSCKPTLSVAAGLETRQLRKRKISTINNESDSSVVNLWHVPSSNHNNLALSSNVTNSSSHNVLLSVPSSLSTDRTSTLQSDVSLESPGVQRNGDMSGTTNNILISDLSTLSSDRTYYSPENQQKNFQKQDDTIGDKSFPKNLWGLFLGVCSGISFFAAGVLFFEDKKGRSSKSDTNNGERKDHMETTVEHEKELEGLPFDAVSVKTENVQEKSGLDCFGDQFSSSNSEMSDIYDTYSQKDDRQFFENSPTLLPAIFGGRLFQCN